ncbi:HAMP domain-containing sensor histidine kinase [uncultured Eubacterium sp.]|uniref:sensor histidine kinase n=1 Tax=uncultured Eubacterium sp. TaxID=165185 RepID=UPI0025E64BB4|nr:HAMP domain-containing sensor histidine kinase [uncultured Eubacterium sp.]
MKKTKNLNIASRIAIATLSSIATSIIMITVVVLVFRSLLPDIYGIARVESNSYSLLNQMQWAQTISSINRELTDNTSDEAKQKDLRGITRPIDELGSKIYITKDGELFYSNTDKSAIDAELHELAPNLKDDNIILFGENGLVVQSHTDSDNGSYMINITNTGYTVADSSMQSTLKSFKAFFTGRSGFIIFMALFIILISNLIMSVIASRTITAPIKKLSDGANEIAGGNLDYHIDYDSTNEIGTTVKSINDMTEKLKNLMQTKEEIEQSRKEMTAGIAHDLRTPLTSIKGYVEGLMDGIANTPEKQERYLNTIYSSAKDMENLLDELLTLSRFEEGKIKLEQIRIDIVQFLREYLNERPQDNRAVITFTPPSYKGSLDVMLDPNRFSRVLNNIISNAIKYSSTARKPRIDISLEVYDKSVIIALKDNGIGISDENLKHIFESFYRADQARTRVQDGSGLGLAVCKEIVELHNGHIWATSKEGSGTTMMISLQRYNGEDTK